MMGILDNFRNWLLEPLLGAERIKQLDMLQTRRAYRLGEHRAPIKTADDAIIVNFIGLLTDRTVAMLFGKEPAFDLPGEADSEEQQYIDAVWKINRKQHLLKTLAIYGAEAGTCYLKILPEGVVDQQGNFLPRLIAIDPAFVTMDTVPEDADTVWRYTIAYTVIDPITERDKAIKQVIAHEAEKGIWIISDYVSIGGAQWEKTGEQRWEWDFPPILHWQNLPEPGTPYGRADISADLIDLQDKINFVSSNTAKIIKYHAYPKTWARGFGRSPRISWGVDEMVTTDDPNALIQNLEMQSDLGSSLNFIRYLRQALFDVAHSVDIDNVADKLYAITTFELRVLYQDALNRIEEKRGLFGEAITEINRRILTLAGKKNTDGGEVDWGDILPVNEIERAQALKTDLELGLVSRQTASGRRGYVWEDEEERMADEEKVGRQPEEKPVQV